MRTIEFVGGPFDGKVLVMDYLPPLFVVPLLPVAMTWAPPLSETPELAAQLRHHYIHARTPAVKGGNRYLYAGVK